MFALALGCGPDGVEAPQPDATGSSTADDTSNAAGSEATAGSEPTAGAADSSGTAPSSESDDDGGADDDGETTGGAEACEFPSRCDAPSPYRGAGDCDPYAQDCPDGERCVPVSDDGEVFTTTQCVAVSADPLPVGSACTSVGGIGSGEDDCEVGTLCLGLPDGDRGVCTELCGCGPDAGTCAGDGVVCAIAHSFALAVCLPACDPFDSESCGPGYACVDGRGRFYCRRDVSGAGGEQGSPCVGLGAVVPLSSACAPGLTCELAQHVPGCTAGACCTAYCDQDVPQSCAPGQTCQPLDWPEQCPVQAGRCRA